MVLYLYKGFKRGFLFRLLDLVFFLAGIFIAWPVGQALASAYPIFQNTGMDAFFNVGLWFLIVQMALRIVAMMFYKVAKWIKKLKIYGFFDKLMGLLLSCIICFLTLCLVVLFLQMPFVGNGELYIRSSPLLWVQNVMEFYLPLILGA